MTLPFIRVVFVSIMHEWVLKSEWYSFFLSVWPHNAKSIKLKEIGKALDDGGPSEQLKWRLSIDSTPPSSQQDSQDNTRLDSQRSLCRWWAHLPYSTITGAYSNLALLYVVACCVWCLACIASNFVELHLLTLHIMPVNRTRVPVSRTYVYMMSTSPLLHHHGCLLLLGTVIRGCVFHMTSSLYFFWLCWIASV